MKTINISLNQLQLNLIIGALDAHADNLSDTALGRACRDLYERLLKGARERENIIRGGDDTDVKIS